jgi:glucokinase
VVAAGTGLGQAGLFWDGRRMRPFACEGGHTTFSPTDAVGDALLRRLRKRHQTVSWERVLSGSGLRELYLTLLEQRDQPEPEWFREAESQGGEAAAISRYGLDGTCGVCRQTLEIFARLYGEEAANLALKLMARGGVWIAGGIAPKILPVLEAGHFMDGFLRKGRMRSLLETVPVRVIVDELAPLRGAALRAAS